MTSTHDPRLRLAFGNICTHQWIAGCHYLKNLFLALRQTAANPEVVLYGASADDSQRLVRPLVDQTLSSPWDRSRLIRWAYRLERFLGLPVGLSRLAASDLRAHGVAALYSPFDQGPWFNLPLLAWIPDFQHVHLPDMFSSAERQLRDNAYYRTARRADRVILSSQSALEDYRRFAPQHTSKARVVNFVAHPEPAIYSENPAGVCERYHLPAGFIYLPNQFWKHKNHAVVVEALGILHAQHRDLNVTVVCSGNTKDARQPHYFRELQARIEALGVQDRFIILGMIPHDDVYQLLRQAQAILQPSLFEGWSTSIEEAKSIGKRVILSDLAVHREQAPPAAAYFAANDAQSLAELLAATAAEAPPGPDILLEQQARDSLPRRSRQFGETFLNVVGELVRKPTS